MQSLLRKIFGIGKVHSRDKYTAKLGLINKLESSITSLSDVELKEKSITIRECARNGSTLDELLVEAYAVGREVARRTLGLRPFDVQIKGAMALHDGYFVEMKTGEGKTLVAILAAYLNSLAGKGVHVVTVNDYLAQRDADWMGPFYRFLGISVGVILEDMGNDRGEECRIRRRAYNCDVTYGTNNEFAFDYLRDNLAQVPEDIVQRRFHYAIVDEVDNLLIDEARTPLIISGPAFEGKILFQKVDGVVKHLRERTHYEVDNKTHSVNMTEAGFDAVEKGLGVSDLTSPEHINIYHAVHHSLFAHGLYKRDVDYIVENGKVVIVDEFTGRVSEDKRYSDGRHQAIEAKEGVKLQAEDQTLAKITYQTFFGLYEKLSGMSGTVWQEREEFKEVYGRDVKVLPTNRPNIRVDYQDEVYNTFDEKHQAIVQEIYDFHNSGQPVLVGTSSVKESEQLSFLLRKKGVSHSVLNARNHREEAKIISQAGRKGAVTISTNMAGRGTDIVLGGNSDLMVQDNENYDKELLQISYDREREIVITAGGLHVIGTAHHESTRIDAQLRGRGGRQGDPGSSQFIISLEDEIWKKFGESKVKEICANLQKFQQLKGLPISSQKVKNTLRKFQGRIERENQSIRMEVLKYDLVVHAQREAIYSWRKELISGEGYKLDDLVQDTVKDLIEQYPDRNAFVKAFQMHFNTTINLPEQISGSNVLTDIALARAHSLLRRHEEIIDPGLLQDLGQRKILQIIDFLWTEHLHNLEMLEENIGYEAYAGIDPIIAYRNKAGQMWQDLIQLIRSRAVTAWFHVNLV